MSPDIKFDRCIKTADSPDIWMVRESTRSRVKFEYWEDYEAAGSPAFAEVSDEELAAYRPVGYFRG